MNDDKVEPVGAALDAVAIEDFGTLKFVLSLCELANSVHSPLETITFYESAASANFNSILNDQNYCTIDVIGSPKEQDENLNKYETSLAQIGENINALDELNRFSYKNQHTLKHLAFVDGKVRHTMNQLQHKIDTIIDNIFSGKIRQTSNPKIDKIVDFLRDIFERFTHDVKYTQSLPLDKRIIFISDGNLDYFVKSRTADSQMASSLEEIIDLGIAIPSDQTDALSLALLELLCHSVDVYLFIVTFVTQQYGIVATDAFYKGDTDKYDQFMSEGAKVYNEFSSTLMSDSDGFVHTLVTRVLDQMLKDNFSKSRQFIDFNLNKFEQIQNFFNQMKFHSDVEYTFVKDINFDGTIPTPILDWNKGSKVRYTIQYAGNRTMLSSLVSDNWVGLTLDALANPFVTIEIDNSNRTRVILRKFDYQKPQIVAFITNSTQSVFRDIDRDLFNSAFEPNAPIASKNVEIYLKNKANPSTMFEHGKRAIHGATENNNWQVAHALIKSGANINQVDENGFSPIHIAAESGYEQFVDELIELKADVNAVTEFDTHQLTSLHCAVYKNQTKIVTKLLSVPSIDNNPKTTEGFTPLNLAVFKNNKEVIDTFLNASFSNRIVDTQNKAEFTPLYFAYRNNATDVVHKLIDHCANVNIRLYNDKTFLHLAVIYSDLNVVEQLIDDFDVSVQDAQGRTALHYAVMLGNEELTKFFINRNADPNAVDSNGTPVIIFTVNLPEEKALAIIRALVFNGADFNEQSKSTNNGILHFACALGYSSVVAFLLANKANVNLLNSQNETPLHLASKLGRLDIVKRLIEYNANFTSISDTNETAMEYAVKGDGNFELFKYFVEDLYRKSFSDEQNKIAINNCAILSIRYFKNDIFKYIINNQFISTLVPSVIESLRSGNQEMFEFLFANGASKLDPVLDPSSGWTALYFAIMGNGGYRMVKYIIENQPKFASLSVDDKKYGKTLLHLAIETKKGAVAKLLLGKQADFDNADFEGETQLHYASKYGLTQIADQLIGIVDKSTINKKNKQNKTPLFVGVEGEANLNLIQGLINAGASLDGDEKQSLLDAAIVANKTDVARIFKDQPINKANLHVAAANSNIELVDLLVDYKKIDINLEDSQNRKPIYSAVEGNGTLAMIQHLVSRNADINHFNESRCDNLITLAIKKKKLDIAWYLIGVDRVNINKVGASMQSPLYQAVYVDNQKLVKILLEKGADYNFKLPNGTTPIDLILDNKSNTINYFAYDYRNEQNQTMLHLMAALDKVKVVQKLLERGAYVNAQDNYGNSPLHLAAKNGFVNTVQMLCDTKQKCINVELKNADKQTALDLAKSNHQTKVVDFLENWHPNSITNQRTRREIVEQFSEKPVSSGTGRASWWVSDLLGSVVGTFSGINEAYQSMVSPSYYESRTASAQSISSLSASVNVHSTLLLLDVLARKFTGQSYVGTDRQSISPLDVRSNSLAIVEQFERMLNRLAKETNSPLVTELDSFELYRSVENCLLSSQHSKIDHILLSTARDAFSSDSVEKSLLVMSVKELLNEVLLGKMDSSLVETSSM